MVGYIHGFWWVVAWIQYFLFLFLSLPHFFPFSLFLPLLLVYLTIPSDQSDSSGGGGGWIVHRTGTVVPISCKFFWGSGVFKGAMTLAMVEFCVTESAHLDVAISLVGGILYFERSSALTSCFSSRTDMGVFPSLWGFGQDLVTNKFAQVDEVKSHGVIVLTGLDIVGGMVIAVVTVVVGTRVAGVLGSTRGFQLTLPYIVSYCTGDPCFSSLILLWFWFWRVGFSRVMVYQAL